MAEDSFDDELPLYDWCPWSWANQQVAALRRRDVDAIDWQHLSEEIDPKRERLVWVSECTHAIRWMLQIEYYPADAQQISVWRAKAWRYRMQLHYESERNPGLLKHHLDSMLTESWGYARDIAEGRMAWRDTKLSWQDTGSKGDNRILAKALWRRECTRWDRRLPADCEYSFEEIVGYNPQGKQPTGEPDPAFWPLGVTQKFREVFGPDLNCPDNPAL